jgi:hypothetical protein
MKVMISDPSKSHFPHNQNIAPVNFESSHNYKAIKGWRKGFGIMTFMTHMARDLAPAPGRTLTLWR